MRTTNTASTSTSQRAHDGQKIRAEVVLGSPSANCSGVGICRVMAYGDGANISCPKTEARVSLTNEGRMRFEFLKSTMETRFLRRHFRWMLFQVFEPYTVPYRLFGAHRISERTIAPGIYQVWDVEDRLIVDF